MTILGRPAVAAATPPGADTVLHATSLIFPAAQPMCEGLVGYTPSGLAQNVAWDPPSGLFVYAGEP